MHQGDRHTWRAIFIQQSWRNSFYLCNKCIECTRILGPLCIAGRQEEYQQEDYQEEGNQMISHHLGSGSLKPAHNFFRHTINPSTGVSLHGKPKQQKKHSELDQFSF